MIYLFDNLPAFSDELFWRSLRIIPAERRKKALSYRRLDDRKLSVIAYLLLQYGVGKEYGIWEHLEFCCGPQEKPYLKHHPDIYFNLSHCRNGVVCGIAQEEIGIDIEAIDEYDEQLANMVCNESEYNDLQASPDKRTAFYRLWTQKESVLKYRGEGIGAELKEVLAHAAGLHIATRCVVEKGYVLSLCQRRK